MSVALAPLSDLVSSRTGIIRHVTRVNRGATEPVPPVFYQARLTHFDFQHAKPQDRIGIGKAATDEEAIAAAIAEALERYCASQPDTRQIQKFARKGHEKDTLSPVECVLYSERQYASGKLLYKPWSDDTEVFWVPSRELPGERSIWVPASLVYLDYLGNDADRYYCAPTSNGLAAGPDLPSAILAGLYELIERDGFLITWMNRLRVPEVRIPSSLPIETSFLRFYRQFDIETRVFMLATDMPVYVMMAVLLHRDLQGPAVVVGLGCNPDPRKAVRKALFETAQVHTGEVERCMDPSYKDKLQSYEDVKTLEDHSTFFASPKRLSEFAFLLENNNRENLKDLSDLGVGSVPGNLDVCVDALRGAGCGVVYTNLTTPDLQGHAVRVVRTIASRLQPIHFGYGQERLGGNRLYQLPRMLGYTSSATDEDSINRCPHPLP
jgi:ribosomal protein S12 methylthiotransferase accessory factor